MYALFIYTLIKLCYNIDMEKGFSPKHLADLLQTVNCLFEGLHTVRTQAERDGLIAQWQYISAAIEIMLSALYACPTPEYREEALKEIATIIEELRSQDDMSAVDFSQFGFKAPSGNYEA